MALKGRTRQTFPAAADSFFRFTDSFCRQQNAPSEKRAAATLLKSQKAIGKALLAEGLVLSGLPEVFDPARWTVQHLVRAREYYQAKAAGMFPGGMLRPRESGGFKVQVFKLAGESEARQLEEARGWFREHLLERRDQKVPAVGKGKKCRKVARKTEQRQPTDNELEAVHYFHVHQGNISKAAKACGISRRTFRDRMRRARVKGVEIWKQRALDRQKLPEDRRGQAALGECDPELEALLEDEDGA